MPPDNNRRSGPMDRLKAEAGGLVGALADRAVSSVQHKIQGTTGRLTDYVEGDHGPGLMAAVTGARSVAEGNSPGKSMLKAGVTGLKEKVASIFRRGGGKGGGKQKLKLTNIVESVEVGVPVRVAYNQWTSYQDFPTFTKKVENAQPDANDQEYKVSWKAQIFWSHREWQATIIDQRPDERIVWRSKGKKGHVDGAVTFHEVAPNLTKIVVVLEYHPQGLFERTGNLWRAQGRRTRLELKHFQRHVMAHTLLDPDRVEGWRGVIEDGQIVKDHETVLQEEDEARQPGEQSEGVTEEAAEAPEDQAPQDEVPEDEAPEDEAPRDQADEFEDDEPADTEDEPEASADEDEVPADEEDADEAPRGRRRAPARGTGRGRAPARTR